MAAEHDTYIPAYRKLFEPDHHLSMSRAVCPRFAWLDLCQMATREAREVSWGHELIRLNPGEVLAAVRTMGDRWKWSKSAVSRFLRLLCERDSLRRVRGTPAGAVYLVVNADTYWLGMSGERDSIGTDSGTGGGQAGDKNKTLESKENILSPFLTESSKRGVYSEPFEELWGAYPRNPNDSKREGWLKYKARIRAGVSHDDMMDGVQRYANYIAKSGTDERFVKHLKSFLGTGEHWTTPWDPPRGNGTNGPAHSGGPYVQGL